MQKRQSASSSPHQAGTHPNRHLQHQIALPPTYQAVAHWGAWGLSTRQGKLKRGQYSNKMTEIANALSVSYFQHLKTTLKQIYCIPTIHYALLEHGMTDISNTEWRISDNPNAEIHLLMSKFVKKFRGHKNNRPLIDSNEHLQGRTIKYRCCSYQISN